MQYQGTKSGLAAKLQAYLAQRRAGKGAAISAAIMVKGELVAAFVDGVRGTDTSTASVDDLFNVGSVTKIYCTVAVMKLVEMGKVNLDLPVVHYLPEFSMRDSRYKDISVRMLLNHSSGMPGSNLRYLFTDHWTGDHFLEEYLEYLKYSKLKAAPGEYSVYCNDGFDVAAAIVERVSGKKFIEFLREEITTPAGTLTTGEANVAIGDRKMMSCLGQKPEWVNSVGAGAIRTDLSDCARFGYLFIDPKNVIGKKHLEETIKSQGVTFLRNDHTTPQFGLGWDMVSYKNPIIDLGENALGKAGGTGQFLSYLIVSPKYELSAAISATLDCQLFAQDLLCELIAVALKELGVEVHDTPLTHPKFEAKPIPEDFLEKYGGIYYSSQGVFRAEVKEEKLNILRYMGNGNWSLLPMLPPMQWNGERFFSEINYVFFESFQTSAYLYSRMRRETVLAQKNTQYPAMSSGWKSRLKKKYIVCNLAASDVAGSINLGVLIDQAVDDGVLLFVVGANPFLPPGYTMYPYNLLPAVSAGEDDTDMFLNAPGEGSRNIYAPSILKKDGVEHLRISGYVYIRTDAVPALKPGIVASPNAEQNPIFKTKAGDRLVFEKPENVAVFMLNEDLTVIYSSLVPMKMPAACDGYIIFANDSPFEMRVDVISE